MQFTLEQLKFFFILFIHTHTHTVVRIDYDWHRTRNSCWGILASGLHGMGSGTHAHGKFPIFEFWIQNWIWTEHGWFLAWLPPAVHVTESFRFPDLTTCRQNTRAHKCVSGKEPSVIHYYYIRKSNTISIRFNGIENCLKLLRCVAIFAC